MKAVILAGGYGTRISEESSIRPKPMVEVGGYPIIWHVMKIYYHYGINEFIICLGYKGEVIKEYFANYYLRRSDITVDLGNKSIITHKNGSENWKVTLVDTGESTLTGGRLKKVKKFLENETFCMTYGDGVSNINIGKLIRFHKKMKTLATVTAVQPPGRFGALNLRRGSNRVTEFREKPKGDGTWVNGGFFVLEPQVIDFIDNDRQSWEQEPMKKLAKRNQLSAYRHFDFWHPVDTIRDKSVLEDIWNKGRAPWKVWR